MRQLYHMTKKVRGKPFEKVQIAKPEGRPEGSNNNKLFTEARIRRWHKADMQGSPINVRFRG